MRSKAPQVYWNDSELVTDHSWGQVLKDASPLSVISLPLSLQLLAVVCSVRCSAYKQLQHSFFASLLVANETYDSSE